MQLLGGHMTQEVEITRELLYFYGTEDTATSAVKLTRAETLENCARRVSAKSQLRHS